jgi:hypothetical protein
MISLKRVMCGVVTVTKLAAIVTASEPDACLP